MWVQPEVPVVLMLTVTEGGGCVILTPAPLLSALVFRLVSGEEEKKLGC